MENYYVISQRVERRPSKHRVAEIIVLSNRRNENERS